MCGIAGIVAKKSNNYKTELSRMTRSLSHRGPDGEGTEFFGDCALGHRRLSIVDLRSGGQPMFSPDKKLAVTFNGEIYGYKEIREKIKDYKFQTQSDTEIILALYSKYGDNFLAYLPGMFAFAIWDEKKKKLIGARDRFGEKPFYYAFGRNGEFLFASEIKALLASDLIKPKLNYNSLIHYLKHLYVHPHRTIYENIYVLPPAHCFIYENGKISIGRYWQLPEPNYSLNLDEAIPEFKRLFNQAVERQLVADVPVGAFLSGGLDSSTVVAVASQYKKNLETIAFGFGDSMSELPYAREIAGKYNTSHAEVFADEDLSELLLKMQDVYDEPFGDSSNIPTYLISRLARKYTKVALTGDGGDELLAGYGWYQPFLYLQNKNIASFFWRNYTVGFIAKAMTHLIFDGRSGFLDRHLGAKYSAEFSSLTGAHLSQDLVFDKTEIKKLGLTANEDEQSIMSFKEEKNLNDVMKLDLENYMPGDILVKIDRASMANGLELRAPFLDVDFASFCISLPFYLKINKETDKYILRKAFGDAWTRNIRQRSKQGFGAPVRYWLSENPGLARLKSEYLENKNRRIFEIISYDNSRNFVEKNNYQTWALLVLAVWLESRNNNLFL